MADACSIALDVSDGITAGTTAAHATDALRTARFDLTGLDPDTAYTYQVRRGGELTGPVGRFRTLPVAAGEPASFTVAFSGDAETGSNHVVFDTIRASSPLAFIHLGDLHYENNGANDQSAFHAAYDRVLRQSNQAALYREVPTVYVWDDHDYGNNNSDGTSASKPAAAAVYRARVPHYPLEESTGVYHSFDIGRVRFVVTDQRSASSPSANTDNSSKTMLGAAQKAWFKALLADSDGMLIVWICPRWFQPGASTNADHWGAFTTERTEIADHIKAHCHGRVVVLSADLHTLGIDDGSNHDFATGGGEPLRTFQAAPLDQTPISFGGVYSEGGEFTERGQWGTMAVVDTGGSTIGVTWTGRDSSGAALTSYGFSVSV